MPRLRLEAFSPVPFVDRKSTHPLSTNPQHVLQLIILVRLRCDRLRPCNSCDKRGLQCVYIINPAPPPRNAPSRSTKHLQLRIRHLEELVNSLRNTEDKSPRVDLESESQHDLPEDAIASSLGKIHVGEAGMSYVSGAHWMALQDSVLRFIPERYFLVY